MPSCTRVRWARGAPCSSRLDSLGLAHTHANSANPDYLQLRALQLEKWAQERVTRGIEYARSRNIDKALACYKQALRYDPKCTTALVGIGAACVALAMPCPGACAALPAMLCFVCVAFTHRVPFGCCHASHMLRKEFDKAHTALTRAVETDATDKNARMYLETVSKAIASRRASRAASCHTKQSTVGRMTAPPEGVAARAIDIVKASHRTNQSKSLLHTLLVRDATAPSPLPCAECAQAFTCAFISLCAHHISTGGASQNLRDRC